MRVFSMSWKLLLGSMTLTMICWSPFSVSPMLLLHGITSMVQKGVPIILWLMVSVASLVSGDNGHGLPMLIVFEAGDGSWVSGDRHKNNDLGSEKCKSSKHAHHNKRDADVPTSVTKKARLALGAPGGVSEEISP
ncbi:hypothetical protein V6N13_099347 [Hibiscus sabdariffa]